jgi:hypothetical protein
MKNTLLSAVLLAACGLAGAKLPAPDEAAKAKAAETAAKAAWQAKVDAYQLCKAQDRVAAAYRSKTAGKANVAAVPASAAKTAMAQPAAPAAAPAVAAAPVTPVAPAMAAASAVKPGASAATGAVTPVAATAPPASCADPGPFAYTPPEQKPLETSGAHSPAATAASPPSVLPHTGQLPQPGAPKK